MLQKLMLRKLIRLVLGIFHDKKTHVPSSGGGFLVLPCQIREKKKQKKEKHDLHVLFFESVDCCAVLCYV
jgi:hypothetical protein